MIIVAEEDMRREEATPHGKIGMSTAFRMTADIPNRTMEFRKRILHSGSAIGTHPIDHDEVYYVVSGEGEVHSNDQTSFLGAGMMAYFYSGDTVGIRQIGETPLELIISYPLSKPVFD
ncbi:cupin domain-containing protein [Rhizobium skierniewicense]|uniref:cupin domain-containing protein n=1 Tax=Rhizobium skierniewicense TaxID=984260 RepID=UPI001572BBCE|nr:cupin domain-containing protein [Rhizobium skierniewicense]NTF33438.1 cupin domain-containing protein [Rhizobium skierniewicense]